MNKRLFVWLAVGAVTVAAALALTTPASAVKKDINSGELLRLQSTGAWVIDVRTAGEYSGAHIPNAVNVPLEQIQEAAATWNKDQPVIVYCATGARSAIAAAYLAGQGFRKVYDLDKGIASWTGEVVGGSQGSSSVPSGPGAVKTDGKPVFIDFASST